MSIKFACENCGKAYKVPEKFAGKKVKCKQCGDPVRVPAESNASVDSARAAQVSKRSVVSSQRASAAKSSRKSRAESGSSSRKSSKSGGSARSAKTSGGSKAVKAAKPKAPKKALPGEDTGEFTAVDLEAGNLTKAYQRKKEETFEKGTGRLTYFEEEKPKKAYKLVKGKDVKVGRDGGCKVSLELASLSREHMKIEYKLGTFIAQDLGSTNGIVVNGRNVRRASLRDGDIIQLGEAIFRFDCG